MKGPIGPFVHSLNLWKDTHQEERIDQGFERLEHPPGEAQVDFGTMEVVQDGEFKDVHLLIMTMPYSFAVGYPAENQECFWMVVWQPFFEQFFKVSIFYNCYFSQLWIGYT